MTIDDIFADIYGIPPDGYYKRELRSGADAASTLLDINRKIKDIWDHEKKGGFYSVDENDIPEGFI